ncbi:MAG: Gfo/Idh/MocA family oxidoreductase [Actinobacteria bacterium]|jgi:predicted dehydrogenase|nr:Gfo/Idh/MocA family oxidoreductase [Actinomycetota bacterium]
MPGQKIKVAIVGLGFGADFIPIYQQHPYSELYAICQRSEDNLKAAGKKYGIDRLYTDYKDLLKIKELDAIHIVTPADTHAPIVLDCLKAEKHVACTVPMAIDVEDCKEIVKMRRKAGVNYMMMETAAYSREFLYVKKLKDAGKLGKIQFLRGSHMQDMEEWGAPWPGWPPLNYATHAVSPLAILADAPVEWVFGLGSGRVRDSYIKNWNCPFAVESMLMKFKNSDIGGEVTRSLYDTVRQYIESFDVFGQKLSFEWSKLESEDPILYTGKEDFEKIKIPDTDDMLPKEIARFTKSFEVMDEEEKSHLSFIQGSGHGGSHPHLVNEFVMSIVEKRDSAIDAEKAANWSSAGVLGNKSAVSGSEKIYLPDFWNL